MCSKIVRSQNTSSAAEATKPNSSSARVPWYMETGPFGTIVAISGIASLTASYFYDFGFFFKLGTSFSQAPTTIIDHMQSWMIWLPVIAPISVSLLIICLAARPKQKNLSEDRVQAATPISIIIRKRRKFLAYFGLGLASYFSGVFLGNLHAPLIITVFAAWGWTIFIAYLYVRQGSLRRRSTRLAGALIVIPSVMFIAFGLGYQDAHLKVQRNEKPTHRVYSSALSNDLDASFEDVRLVRVFAMWMLVLDRNGSVVWLDLNHVTKFQRLK